MFMLLRPESYDVVVSTNMFGDILTDLGSVLQGGMGMAVGCNVGDDHAMFEPIHGSAPPNTAPASWPRRSATVSVVRPVLGAAPGAGALTAIITVRNGPTPRSLVVDDQVSDARNSSLRPGSPVTARMRSISRSN